MAFQLNIQLNYQQQQEYSYSLDSNLYNAIYDHLDELSQKQHEIQFQTNLLILGLKKSAGQYIGNWHRLKMRWINQQVNNQFVIDSLNACMPLDDANGVEFIPSNIKKSKRIPAKKNR